MDGPGPAVRPRPGRCRLPAAGLHGQLPARLGVRDQHQLLDRVVPERHLRHPVRRSGDLHGEQPVPERQLSQRYLRGLLARHDLHQQQPVPVRQVHRRDLQGEPPWRLLPGDRRLRGQHGLLGWGHLRRGRGLVPEQEQVPVRQVHRRDLPRLGTLVGAFGRAPQPPMSLPDRNPLRWPRRSDEACRGWTVGRWLDRLARRAAHRCRLRACCGPASSRRLPTRLSEEGRRGDRCRLDRAGHADGSGAGVRGVGRGRVRLHFERRGLHRGQLTMLWPHLRWLRGNLQRWRTLPIRQLRGRHLWGRRRQRAWRVPRERAECGMCLRQVLHRRRAASRHVQEVVAGRSQRLRAGLT